MVFLIPGSHDSFRLLQRYWKLRIKDNLGDAKMVFTWKTLEEITAKSWKRVYVERRISERWRFSWNMERKRFRETVEIAKEEEADTDFPWSSTSKDS